LFENEEIPIKDFIQAVRNSNYNKGERIIKSGGLTTQGKLSTLAYVIRGKQIPSKWVNISKHVLYPSERPFIK